MRVRIVGAVFWIFFCLVGTGQAEVYGRFVPNGKQVALTFDACETKTPSFFDTVILDYIKGEQLPVTFFLSGWFAQRNASHVEDIAKLPFIEIENHSESHVANMEKLTPEEIRSELRKNEDRLVSLTGWKTRFFRFPAGSFDPAALKVVEEMGYIVTHWAFPSGDPDKKLTPEALTAGVLGRVQPGDILIFHINGRGWSTGLALPGIVSELRKRGYSFVRLRDIPPSSFRP